MILRRSSMRSWTARAATDRLLRGAIYLAGLPEEAYLSEFIAAPTEDIGDDEVPGGEGDDLIPTDM